MRRDSRAEVKSASWIESWSLLLSFLLEIALRSLTDIERPSLATRLMPLLIFSASSPMKNRGIETFLPASRFLFSALLYSW